MGNGLSGLRASSIMARQSTFLLIFSQLCNKHVSIFEVIDTSSEVNGGGFKRSGQMLRKIFYPYSDRNNFVIHVNNGFS